MKLVLVPNNNIDEISIKWYVFKMTLVDDLRGIQETRLIRPVVRAVDETISPLPQTVADEDAFAAEYESLYSIVRFISNSGYLEHIGWDETDIPLLAQGAKIGMIVLTGFDGSESAAEQTSLSEELKQLDFDRLGEALFETVTTYSRGGDPAKARAAAYGLISAYAGLASLPEFTHRYILQKGVDEHIALVLSAGTLIVATSLKNYAERELIEPNLPDTDLSTD